MRANDPLGEFAATWALKKNERDAAGRPSLPRMSDEELKRAWQLGVGGLLTGEEFQAILSECSRARAQERELAERVRELEKEKRDQETRLLAEMLEGIQGWKELTEQALDRVMALSSAAQVVLSQEWQPGVSWHVQMDERPEGLRQALSGVGLTNGATGAGEGE